MSDGATSRSGPLSIRLAHRGLGNGAVDVAIRPEAIRIDASDAGDGLRGSVSRRPTSADRWNTRWTRRLARLFIVTMAVDRPLAVGREGLARAQPTHGVVPLRCRMIAVDIDARARFARSLAREAGRARAALLQARARLRAAVQGAAGLGQRRRSRRRGADPHGARARLSVGQHAGRRRWRRGQRPCMDRRSHRRHHQLHPRRPLLVHLHRLRCRGPRARSVSSTIRSRRALLGGARCRRVFAMMRPSARLRARASTNHCSARAMFRGIRSTPIRRSKEGCTNQARR